MTAGSFLSDFFAKLYHLQEPIQQTRSARRVPYEKPTA